MDNIPALTVKGWSWADSCKALWVFCCQKGHQRLGNADFLPVGSLFFKKLSTHLSISLNGTVSPVDVT